MFLDGVPCCLGAIVRVISLDAVSQALSHRRIQLGGAHPSKGDIAKAGEFKEQGISNVG